MITNPYVQNLLKQLFGNDGKTAINTQDLLNYYLKQSKTNRPLEFTINQEITRFFIGENQMISK